MDDDAGGPRATDSSMTRNTSQTRPSGSGGDIAPLGIARIAGIRRLEAAMRNPRDPIVEMQAVNRALKREMMRDLS